jgi:hypothetical protein
MMITIKCITNDGRDIQYNYDSAQQAMRPWRFITMTGRTPDDAEAISRAYYFGAKNKPGDGPDKCWMS